MSSKLYQGHLLVANPANPSDSLEQAVILLVTHDENKAVGLQINRPLDELSLASIMENLSIPYDGDAPVYLGGSVNSNKIHIIHTTDWSGPATQKINDVISLTNDTSILRALSKHKGPRKFIACSGHWLWEDHTLDQQLHPHEHLLHRWEVAEATEKSVFNIDPQDSWVQAIEMSADLRVSEWC